MKVTKESIEQKLQDNSGVTLIEVLIVIAIIAIIGAIVVPNFMSGTQRARLRSDLQSTLVLRNAVELYRVETGQTPTGDIGAILDMLHTEKYITAELNAESPQTEGLKWVFQNETIYLSPRSELSEEVLSSLSPQDDALITN